MEFCIGGEEKNDLHSVIGEEAVTFAFDQWREEVVGFFRYSRRSFYMSFQC